jgi:hypothetical protein
MISGECFTGAWQARKREELGGCDPVLLEKTIHAIALLDALAARGLDFVFKGGTSLLLRLPRIRRLSIDADILCQEAPEKLDRLLAEVARTSPFSRFTEDDRGPDRVPARRHFKFHYTPLDSRNPAPFVLLDVVHERNLYPVVEAVPLPPAFIEGEGTLPVPTIEGLLGDKLTAFAPNTTGVPLRERTTMQFMKQVFDVGELFDAAADMAAVREAYGRIFEAENSYRGGGFTPEQGLDDTFETAYRMAWVGLSKAPADGRCELIEKGRRELDSHLVGHRFRREEMKEAAAKAALLARALRHGSLPAFETLRFGASQVVALRDARFPAAFSAIAKLKTAPAAIWYWQQALGLMAENP